MAPSVPRLYLFYGDDSLAMSEALDGMSGKLGDPSSVAFNAQRVPGANLDLSSLEQAVAARPFLSTRRLIIIPDAEHLPNDASFRQRFHQLLQDLPETSALVLIENHDLGSLKQLQQYQKASPWYAWAAAHPEVAFVRKFARPRAEQFAQWIENRCMALGGTIASEAAQLLADYLDNDPSLANQELRKLLDYVDRGREITSADIELLSPIYGQADVFAMVDALGLRQRSQAMQLLHRLLQDREARFVFAMVIRQFRLLLQAREAIEAGEHPTESLRLHPFAARKIAEQARSFQLGELESIYRRLMELDLAVKTGRADLNLNLEGALAGLAA